MIWQEKVSLIVMLTKMVENGKTKSDHYLPFDNQKEDACEGISIEMVRESGIQWGKSLYRHKL